MPNNLVVVTKNAYAASNMYKFQIDPYFTNKKTISLDISLKYVSDIFLAHKANNNLYIVD